MRRELAGNMALDAGALLEMLYSTPGGVRVREALKSGALRAMVTDVALTEVRYVLCRERGEAESRSRMADLLGSGFLTVRPDSELSELAAGYKCRRGIALADCFSLALAKKAGAPALFARRESELAAEIKKGGLGVDVLFLEELL